MACAYLTDLSQAIWVDLGQPTDLSVSAIQTKLVSQAFLGALNTLTANCYVITTGDIAPALGTDEQGIYALMYERDYYATRINQMLAGTSPAWTTIADGDSRVTRVSTVDQARVFRDLQKQLNDQLRIAVTAYRQDQASPNSVNYLGVAPTWPGGGSWGGRGGCGG